MSITTEFLEVLIISCSIKVPVSISSHLLIPIIFDPGKLNMQLIGYNYD